MTFIQAKHKSGLTRIIVLLMLALFTGTFGIIFLYNKVVDLDHAIAKTKLQLEQVGASNTQLNNKIVAIVGGGDLTSVANESGLVIDKQPQYFSIAAAAPAASQAAIAAR